MTVIHHLDQNYIDTQLVCPPGITRMEFVDPMRTGLYVEVRSVLPGQGTYYLRYKDAAKKTCHHRIARTTELRLEDARSAALSLKASFAHKFGRASAPTPTPVVHGSHEKDGASGLTLDSFMTEHYFPHARVHKRSHGRDEQLYRLRIKARFGHLPLKAIARLGVQQFQHALVAEGLAKATVNQHITLIRRVLNLAVSWEMLEKNVLTRIELLTLDNQRDHFLDNDQVDRLVSVLKTDKNRMVSLALMFLLATGARLNEALSAEWKHVDLTRGTWRIPATNSKSKKHKNLPLNDSAMWVLNKLESVGDSPLLFPSPITGRPFTTITRQWYRLRAKAAIPANTRIHDLRHTFASRMVAAGCSLFEVQQLLGHADARTSQRYAHMADDVKRAASAKAAFAVA